MQRFLMLAILAALAAVSGCQSVPPTYGYPCFWSAYDGLKCDDLVGGTVWDNSIPNQKWRRR